MLFFFIFNILHCHGSRLNFGLLLLLTFFVFLKVVTQSRLARSTYIHWVNNFACFIIHFSISTSIILKSGRFFRHFYFVSSVHHVHKYWHLIFSRSYRLRPKIFILKLMRLCFIILNHLCWMAKTLEFLFFGYARRFSKLLWNCQLLEFLIKMLGLLNFRIVIFKVVLII